MRASIAELAQIFSECFKDVPGPVFELGSRIVDGGGGSELANLRKLFPGRKYIGIDIEPGEGVDLVYDPEGGVYPDGILKEEKAGIVLCLETLEHAKRPGWLVDDIQTSTGWPSIALFTVPFDFKLHAHPDRWRITPDGMEFLLKDAGYNDFYIIPMKPVDMPPSTCAIAWKGDVDVSKFKERSELWALKWGNEPLAPKTGEPVFYCKHSEEPLAWLLASDYINLTVSGIISKSKWTGLCGGCLKEQAKVGERLDLSLVSGYGVMG